MDDDADNLGVHQLLGYLRGLFAVSGVIFGQQFELGLLAVDHDALGIGFFNGQLGAVFVVLAEVGDLADVGPT